LTAFSEPSNLYKTHIRLYNGKDTVLFNQFTEEENLIRAASFLPSQEELKKQQEELAQSSDPLAALLYSDDRDTILYGIFGDVPDYSNPDMEAIWDEVLESDPEVIFEYCFRKGIDLFQDDGRPVAPWRDIAVMLKAIDKGILQLA
jgi:hypothetical protein